jgi:hypothetical protein
MMIQ